MGRRKQNRPHRSGGAILQNHHPDDSERKNNDHEASQSADSPRNELDSEIDKPYLVEVDSTCWISDQHHDISELVLTNLNLAQDFLGYCLGDQSFYDHSKYSLRFRLCNVRGVLDRIKLGHWPVLSSTDISLEFIEKGTVILSGVFDGPDEGITGLVHLASLKFVSLRPVLGVTLSENMSSLRVRVEILRSAFDACNSLLDNTRSTWKKSMMNAMAWLRPEVVTSEVRYGVSGSTEMETHDTESSSRKHLKFDVAGFYEAITPSKLEPLLDDNIPDLLPELRPYQSRAAYWMVQRERGVSQYLDEGEKPEFFSPLCVSLELLDTCSKMFYNPFSGNITLQAERSLQYVSGGILADEMGMGKTIELLACIFAHPMAASEGIICYDKSQFVEDQKVKVKRLRRERVECDCGAISENRKYKGLWVQCDICDAWQHAECVGYSPKRKNVESNKFSNEEKYRIRQTKIKDAANIVVRDGEHICKSCSELIQATNSPVATGATLIVCPTPILPQWHSEIIRHTRPGSVKTFIYNGVGETSLSNTSLVDMSALISSDVVLTTYDVLKEDLSHDSDRHEGDRRFLRFEKRYPVIPTPLTRTYWWRVCLDEAQMVESNASAATEMASRLYARHRWCITGTPIQSKLDDVYGLLRFVKASPFDVSRWWIEVIRDPYERRDAGAMEFAHKFFKRIMWRNSKINVRDELPLPPQEERVTWLRFSSIEEHFYQRQHETCVSYAREVIESLKDDIVKRKVSGLLSFDVTFDPLITHADAGKLLTTLLKLRQACCHPQVGSSRLRSLQQSPMTMEEILMVLLGKTKVEGEEALRRSVVALNALAGIAVIEDKFCDAISLYMEALALAEDHSADFRLDPLLNIHIHHNLAEILPFVTEPSKSPSMDQHLPRIPAEKSSRKHDIVKLTEHVVKRQKVSGMDSNSLTNDAYNPSENTSFLTKNGLKGDQEYDNELHTSSDLCWVHLKACETFRQKYLAAFTSKLFVAQQEFGKSYMQVCLALRDTNNQTGTWWLEALDHAEQNKLSRELMRKINEAVSVPLNNSRSSRIISRFRSISAVQYHIQTGLDMLEASRKVVLDRLKEIDQTMEKPNVDDIERVRYCRNCQADSDGHPCLLCELDELFQDYEARLFRLNRGHGGMFTSAEEAVEFQKKKSALNRFYWNLSQQNINSNSASVTNEESNKRDVGEKVMVSKQPSELEVVLGVIKSYCKAHLGKEGVLAAIKQLQLLEGMRKEYVHARSLAIAQAQVLNAHDELKMATTRLCLRGKDNDKSAFALAEHELSSASVQYSSDKFMSLGLLSRTKGKLHYLEGLVVSKQNPPVGSLNKLSVTQEIAVMSTFTEKKSYCILKVDEETCPVCQEKLSNQKMVFQCGHVTCCKCLFAMTEQRLLHDNKIQSKWVMCPTCRQHTDLRNISYADDSQNKDLTLHTTEAPENNEASVMVRGSYGTKIEAVTRRILWIKTTNSKAKALVFSSWNDVLDVLEHAFTANGITFIRMKGGRKSHVAINKFRGQKNSSGEVGSVQVLLLLIQHGANGLNLLEAQHVVLVEPLLNPAAEAQAIGRVHRIGQQNKTLVHRFMVKGSVEESIYKLNKSRNSNSFITGNAKNHDQPFLTLREVESLFATVPTTVGENDEKPAETRSLRHLPPSVAAAIAAERRLEEHTTCSLTKTV